ncbi:ATPase [Pullulanibacillus camelliae]|uniref:ATPase n=2 Tax=Pullulanibacillus camelliae TaxID=1707096 RepID=A0A8J2VWT9_9BACL|nr:ATPase [Pullulanibacillus camelliae]
MIIDGKGYKAYKSIKGDYRFPKFNLVIDAVQGDPFASPSKIRIRVSREETAISNKCMQTKTQKMMCEDVFLREIHRTLASININVKGTGKSGALSIDPPGQEILERTAVQINKTTITLCLSVGLPANGRRILGQQAIRLFFEVIPQVLNQSIFALKEELLQDHVQLIDKQVAIREYMKQHNLIAFIGNQAILARESGVSDRPRRDSPVIPFQSPASLEVAIPVPHQKVPIKGMAIKQGITLIVGGGFHGKSTLLRAIEKGVYYHIKGDGREFVLTDPTAVKIRSEDGRSVRKDDISPFINHLPIAGDTERFTTDNASGSTSQAANIVEALEVGTRTLLLDEDTCATNFMIRDARMQALIHKDDEPITPFIDKIQPLFDVHKVSTILVMGGSGDYFDVADTVIKMEHFLAYDVTDKAKTIARQMKSARQSEDPCPFGNLQSRSLDFSCFNSKVGHKQLSKVHHPATIQYGKSSIHLEAVEQLVHPSQTRMIAEIFSFIERHFNRGASTLSLRDLLERIQKQIEIDGLASFSAFNGHPGELARPRIHEVAAAMNRWQHLKVLNGCVEKNSNIGENER